MQCSGKNKYSKKTAEKVCERRRMEDGVRVRAYQCPECGRWHLTSVVRKWFKKAPK